MAHRIWGPPRKGPAPACTGRLGTTRRSPTALSDGSFRWLLSSPPCPEDTPLLGHLPAPDPLRPGVGGWGRRRRGARDLGPALGAGPRRGAQIGSRAPGSCRAKRSGRWDCHILACHELRNRAPDPPDTLQHRRHPKPTHGPRRTLCGSAYSVESRSHVASMRTGGAD